MGVLASDKTQDFRLVLLLHGFLSTAEDAVAYHDDAHSG